METKTKVQTLDAWFLELLACPGCEERRPLHLNTTHDSLLCECGRYAFPIRENIPILLVEEATNLETQTSPPERKKR